MMMTTTTTIMKYQQRGRGKKKDRRVSPLVSDAASGFWDGHSMIECVCVRVMWTVSRLGHLTPG